MKAKSRRLFLRNTFLSLAGTSLLAPARASSINQYYQDWATRIASSGEDEGYWEMIKTQFQFQKGLYYFNNASLGPSSSMVVQATNAFRAELDGFPSKYMWGGWATEKEKVREKAANLLNVSSEEIALIHNTTEGMNLVASSLDLRPGDEVILGNHEHTSGTIPWKYWQESKGVRLVRPELSVLPETKDEIVEVYRKAITPKTKVISMVHITNTNGMILPVKEISELAHRKNILVAVDGAQSAGMIDIDLHELGCDFYAASTHKWLFSPKGMGIFYARKDKQALLKALIVSRGYDDTSIRRLENYNTRNLPELLGLGTALDFQSLIGEERRTKRLYELKHYFRSKIEGQKQFRLKTPALDDLSASIQTVELLGKKVNEVKKELFEQFHIDCRPMSTHGLNGLRISLSLFNTKADIDYLVDALTRVGG